MIVSVHYEIVPLLKILGMTMRCILSLFSPLCIKLGVAPVHDYYTQGKVFLRKKCLHSETHGQHVNICYQLQVKLT